MKRIAFIFWAGLIYGAANSYADKKGEHEGVCRADIEKHCKDVKSGEGRRFNCLQSHEADLSPGCKAKMTRVKEREGDFLAACGGDLETNCKKVKAGHMRKMQCLKEHEAQLTPACKETIGKMKSHRKEKREKRP